jgi:hypothetical protein
MRCTRNPGQAIDPKVSSFSVTYATVEESQAMVADDSLLATIHFGATTQTDRNDPRRITVALPELGGGAAVEVWQSCQAVEFGYEEGFFYSRNDTILFAHTLLDETAFHDLEEATHDAYCRALALLRCERFPHWLRVWNYFPDINRESNALERYKAFCVGRHRALSIIPEFQQQLPPSSAIGTNSPGLLIYLLAAKHPGIPIENPRQVSAYRYPQRYSPKSPSFCRAVVKQWARHAHLYVSGTASIVGHESRHIEDTLSQLEETLRNLKAVIDNANRHVPLGIHTPGELSLLKIYLRDPHDLDPIRHRFGELLISHPPVMFLRGDICRRELSIEIEALYLGVRET